MNAEPSQLPWQIFTVSKSDRGGICVTGHNHYTGEGIAWTIDHYSFRDLEFAARRYDFSRATFACERSRRWLLRQWPDALVRVAA